MIPYGRQKISQADIDAVVEVLRSDYITQGPVVPKFEKAVADYTGAKYGIAVNSGTSALHIACLSLDLGPGDILWTSPISFVASANCGRYCGSNIDFVDIDPDTWNISVSSLKNKLVQARDKQCLPKIVVPVHLAGQPTIQEEIWELAQEFGFRVLEDASHAIGASRKGERVGSCRWSDITVFSFHPVKIITTGEGGMAMTNDEELAWRMGILRTHGISRDSERMTKKPEGPWYYEQLELGMNYRMTDIQAALGLTQLKRLDEFVERRNKIAKKYNEELSYLPLQLPTVLIDNYSSFHLYIVRIKINNARHSHSKVFRNLRESGIGVNLHYIPIHLQPYYQKLGFRTGLFKEAEKYAKDAITLPLHPWLTDEQQSYIIKSFNVLINSNK